MAVCLRPFPAGSAGVVSGWAATRIENWRTWFSLRPQDSRETAQKPFAAVSFRFHLERNKCASIQVCLRAPMQSACMRI